MCTHDEQWAHAAMDEVIHAIDSNVKPAPAAVRVGAANALPEVQVVQREDTIAGAKLHFTALIWSPLTTPLKRQLEFDMTGTPTDCAAAGECKPTRAKVNGQLKDKLMNDCLADALVYEGAARGAIRGAMAARLAQVLDGATDPSAPLVLVSDSLGSKVVFDALIELLGGMSSASVQATARKGSDRLAQVFMNANQLPILGLADQTIPTVATTPSAQGAPTDSLQRYLRLREQARRLKVVALTDPNDLLSYRLMPSRYAGENVDIADVLVSNDKTYFGLLSRPDTVHVGYSANPDAVAVIACGKPRSARCR